MEAKPLPGNTTGDTIDEDDAWTYLPVWTWLQARIKRRRARRADGPMEAESLERWRPGAA